MSTENAELTIEDYASVVGALLSGAKLSTVLNIKKDELETAYALAHSHYSAKNYKNAEQVFMYLFKLDDLDARFSMGLAACYQEQNEYENAITYYKHAMIGSTLEDPRPLYHCALCYIKLDKTKEAIALLEAISKINYQEKFANIYTQAKDLLDLLSKK